MENEDSATARALVGRGRAPGRSDAANGSEYALPSHEIDRLAPTSGWTLLVDDSGPPRGVPAREKRVVLLLGVLVPDGVELPAVGGPSPLASFHTQEWLGESAPRPRVEAVVGALQCLLADERVGILGVRGSRRGDLPNVWARSLEALVRWTCHLLPRPSGGHVTLRVRAEQCASYEKGDVVLARDLLKARLAQEDPERARGIELEWSLVPKPDPSAITGSHGDPTEARGLVLADLLSHTWSLDRWPRPRTPSWKTPARDALCEVLRNARIEPCFLDLDGRDFQLSEDVLRQGAALAPSTWTDALGGSASRLEPCRRSLERLGRSAQSDARRWKRYFRATVQHLESKAIDLPLLGEQIQWLQRHTPEPSDPAGFPPVVRFAWVTAQLEHGNHAGRTEEDLVAELDAIEEAVPLRRERATLACLGDLVRAVEASNRFDFDEMARRLAPWKSISGSVMGTRHHGMLLSSRGQVEAFRGNLRGARARFREAIRVFEQLSDPRDKLREISQTASYLAIASMDDPKVPPSRTRATILRYFPFTPARAHQLARSAAPKDKYEHLLLLRTLVHAPDVLPELEKPYFGKPGKPRQWASVEGHPWPAIEFYRAMLFHRRRGAGLPSASVADHVRRALLLVSRTGAGQTLQLIGCAFAVASRAILETKEWIQLEARVLRRLANLETALPAAADRIARLRRAAGALEPEEPLEMLKDVLPFYFR